jgi:hypothetical protein
VELEHKYLKPALVTLLHLYYCGEVRLFLAKRRPGEIWTPERQLRSEHAQKVKGQSRLGPDVPDAHLTTKRGTLAIEIELSDKKQARLENILAWRAGQY